MNRKKQPKMSRLVVILILIAIQIAWSVIVVWLLSRVYTVISVVTRVLALLICLLLYWRRGNSAFKMPWMLLIMTFPLFGVLMFLAMGNPTNSRRVRKRFAGLEEEMLSALKEDERAEDELKAFDRELYNQSQYIWKYSRYPLYKNTELQFFDDASKGLASQIEALKTAEKFIFMEYHAFEDAEAFKEVKEILYEKAAAGVVVRMIYDDIGSMSFVDREFLSELASHGIECRVFNRLIPIASNFINNRDHKKITVVDGRIGFTGGYNITDEYFNITHPYGQWKDTGVRMDGDAVSSLTAMFMATWNGTGKPDGDYLSYIHAPAVKPEKEAFAGPPAAGEEASGESKEGRAKSSGFEDAASDTAAYGFVQPFADTPLDDEPLGENVYMNIIKSAVDYVYITTPYLILSDEMERELSLAAKRGVDVRIITPGIPDKKIIYQGTRSYYDILLEAGVRIFEYTPGFCHAKQCVCDDRMAVVGTINLDYRSLYLHFEDAVFFCGCSAVADVKADFDETFLLCSEVHFHRHKLRTRLWRAILRLFAPMM